MKYPFLIFIIFISLVTFFILSCGTQNDPAVPNHNSNITTGNNNSFMYNALTFTNMFSTCNVVDTFASTHFMMSCVDVTTQFTISVFFADTSKPSASSQYAIISPIGFTGIFNQNQCLVIFKDPTNSTNPLWFIPTGSVNYDASGAQPACSISTGTIANAYSDTTKHATISGGINCH